MRALGVDADAEIAEALYVGLVTDTGKFMYENTGPRAHVMAAELIDAGVDVHGDLPPPVRGHAVRQARAARRARWRNVERYDDGALTLHAPDARRLRARPAPRRATPRASSTTCARSRARRSRRSSRELLRRRRARPQEGLAARRPTAASTSRRSPARSGGGGHRQAAGFSTELADDELVRVPARAGRRAARR